ncbi:MAG: putative lipid II flippase FtsW [Verrucomicrobiae bacterium]|nr:putative lipid II flippase FtsW [Verrucomicrobiae bacterium]
MNRYVAVVMLVVVFALTGLGLVMLSSVTAPLSDSANQLQKQLIWLSGAMVLFSIVGWVDYTVWRRWAWVIFGVSIFMLLLVFVPGIGSRVKGASRWINVLGFKLQPSEFVRIAWVLLLAHYLAYHQARIREWKEGFMWPLGWLMIPLILLRLEPDMGTLILLGATTLVMMYVAGSRVWPLLSVGGLGGVGVIAMLWMLPERRARILAFLHPEEHKEGKFYQIWQGMLAFGSGGTQGLGLGNSRQKMAYLPESTTDSIFAIVGEELGFYVAIAVVMAYMVLLVCGLWIALRAKDRFGMLLGFGLVFGLCVQALINIGTVTASIPPKGMPLPFVSYGGSNLLICYLAIGLLLSIHRQSMRAQRPRAELIIDDTTPRI